MRTAERLTDGWEPELPVADSFLRRAVFNHAAALEMPAGSVGARLQSDDELRMIDAGPEGAMLNSAVLLRPLAGRDDPLLDRVEAFHPRGPALLWSAVPTPDLRPRGWRLEGHPPLMVRPSGGDARPVVPGLRLVEVTDGAALTDFHDVLVRGFPLPDARVLGEPVLEEPHFRMWVGYVDGQPVTCAAAVVTHGVNGVTMVATLPEARGRGYGAAATWAATVADPSLPALLVASDLGRPVYERLGYLPICRFTLWGR